MKDNSMSSIKLGSTSKLNITQDSVEEEAEVVEGDISSMHVATSCDGVEISNQYPIPLSSLDA